MQTPTQTRNIKLNKDVSHQLSDDNPASLSHPDGQGAFGQLLLTDTSHTDKSHTTSLSDADTNNLCVLEPQTDT